MGWGDTTRGIEAAPLDRRGFVRLSGVGVGLIWAAPQVHSVAPALAGSPAPTPASTTTVQPPAAGTPAVGPTGVVLPRSEANGGSESGTLAVTGAEIGPMTAIGLGAIATGAGLRYAARRLEADEPEPGTAAACAEWSLIAELHKARLEDRAP